MRSVMHSSDGGMETIANIIEPMDTPADYDELDSTLHSAIRRPIVKKDSIQLDGMLDELIRVPASVTRSKEKKKRFDDQLSDIFGLEERGSKTGHNSSVMSMYAAALAHEEELSRPTIRQSQVPKSRLRGMAEAKR